MSMSTGPVSVTCPTCRVAFTVPTEVLGIDGHQVVVRMDRSELYGHLSECADNAGEHAGREHAEHQRDRNDAMQAALREFANPPQPKPDEPKGLGAVVEDAEGRKWVRHDNAPGSFPWISPGRGVESWSYVAAVRVLSEGVSGE